MKDIFINIVVNVVFIVIRFINILFRKIKKTAAIAWPFLINTFNNIKTLLFVLLIVIVYFFIEIFPSKKDEDKKDNKKY